MDSKELIKLLSNPSENSTITKTDDYNLFRPSPLKIEIEVDNEYQKSKLHPSPTQQAEETKKKFIENLFDIKIFHHDSHIHSEKSFNLPIEKKNKETISINSYDKDKILPLSPTTSHHDDIKTFRPPELNKCRDTLATVFVHSPTGKMSPPISPHSSTSSHHSFLRSPSRSKERDAESVRKSAIKSKMIPRFYFPEGLPISPRQQMFYSDFLFTLSQNVTGFLSPLNFQKISQTLCGLGTYCSKIISLKLDPFQKGITAHQFINYWNKHLEKLDCISRLFHLLCSSSFSFLRKTDFIPLIEEVVNRHVGLTFLKETKEFQQRYIQTVICRIFYTVNTTGNNHLTLSELKKSNFLDILLLLDIEDDINLIHDYFSYEHFYTLYVRFWELDTDHNFLISRDDLIRYGNYSLSSLIIDRIMDGIPRTLSFDHIMSYEDFIVFMISEEDKTTPISIEYWFKVLDLEGDCILSPHELSYFFSEQRQHMLEIGEVVTVDDMLCQLNDMINPKNEGHYLFSDLVHHPLVSPFLNAFCNLHKYFLFEIRDPVYLEHQRSTPHLSDWDRFAISEYFRLAGLEDNDIDQNLDSQL